MAKHKPRARKAKIVKGKAAEKYLKTADAVAATEADRRRAEEAAVQKAAAQKRMDELGLREVTIKDCPYRLLCLKDSKAEPTMEQRQAIARRLIEVGPLLPHYVPKGELMKSTSEIQKAFDQNKKDEEQRQKELAKVEKTKAKEEADHVKKITAQRKAAKKIDVTPKVSKSKAKADPVPHKKQAKPGGKTFSVPKVPSGGFNKTNKPATSGELIRARIMEHKMTDAQIATEVRKLFEGRNTSETDVRWNRGQMRLRGIKAPDPVE